MIDVISGLKPADIGLPQFVEFREIQLEAIERVAYSERRFQVLCVSTGGGKSGIAAGIHKLTGWRTAIITPLKGHQEQYSLFASSGLFDIRGKTNYSCDDLGKNCRDGQRLGCKFYSPKRDSECAYDMARYQAKSSKWVCANTAYWMSVYDKAYGLEQRSEDGEIINPFDCLIVDEAHMAPQALEDYLSVYLYEKELKELANRAGPNSESISDWRKFAQDHYRDIETQLKTFEKILHQRGHRATTRELEWASRLENLVDKLLRLSNATDDNWVCEAKIGGQYGRSWEFDIVWAGPYAERYLFQNIPHVVLMSATVRPKTMARLGISEDDYEFHEWPRIFPASRGPIYHLPAVKPDPKDPDRTIMVNIRHKMTSDDKELWLEVVENIVNSRDDRKGVIHCTSYEYQKFFAENLKCKDRLIGNKLSGNEDDTAIQVFKQFSESNEPLILLSPSFGLGWDFAGRLAEFQIIPKVPFKPMISKVMKARLESDPSYGDYLVTQDLVQWLGRIQRYYEDAGESFVCDGALTYLLTRAGYLTPRGFPNLIRRITKIPDRPERLS